jgi:DNA-directed RNA polymerase specialized sigma24 family protein
LTQQVFVELLERMPRDGLREAITEVGSPLRRELNRCIWRLVQRWLRGMRLLPLDGSDCPDASALVCRERLDVLETVAAVATERLTPRQHRILSLVGDGFSIREIAQTLEIPAARVSDEKYRAIQRIRRHLAADDI